MAAGLRTGLGGGGGAGGGLASASLAAAFVAASSRFGLAIGAEVTTLADGDSVSGGAWITGTPGGVSEAGGPDSLPLPAPLPVVWLDGCASTARPAASASPAPSDSARQPAPRQFLGVIPGS